MSTPHDPANDPQPVPPVPPAPTAAPADQTAPYGTAPYAGAPYGEAPSGGAPYGGAPYGGAPQSKQPDGRPKTMALVAMILAIVGAVLAIVGFIPFVGLVFSILGGVILLVAFILSIVALASKKQGGKGLGIAGLIVSIVGGGFAVAAIIVSAFWIALAVNTSSSLPDGVPGPSVSVPADEQPSDEAEDGSLDEDLDGALGDVSPEDQAAYVEDVRPKIYDLIKKAQPRITDEQLDAMYTDDTLAMLGSVTLSAYDAMGEDGVTAEAQSIAEASGGMITADQAEGLVRAILTSAQQYLAE